MFTALASPYKAVQAEKTRVDENDQVYTAVNGEVVEDDPSLMTHDDPPQPRTHSSFAFSSHTCALLTSLSLLTASALTALLAAAVVLSGLCPSLLLRLLGAVNTFQEVAAPAQPLDSLSSTADGIASPSNGFPAWREEWDDANYTTGHFLCRREVSGRQQFEWNWLTLPNHAVNKEGDIVQVMLPEVDVDTAAGTIRIPLFERIMGNVREDNIASEGVLKYLQLAVKEDRLFCRTLHSADALREDAVDPASNATTQWTAAEITAGGGDKWSWLTCTYDARLPPPRLLFVRHKSRLGWENVALHICPYRLPRVFVTGLVKGIYGDGLSQLQHLFDFIGYGLRMGVDYTYVIDLSEERLLFEPFRSLIQRGLVRYLAWPKSDWLYAQQMQNTVFHIWSKRHSQWAWNGDVDEYIVVAQHQVQQRRCPTLGIHCPSALQSALSSPRFVNASGVIFRSFSFPAWPMPAQIAERYPVEAQRYAHNESWYRQLAYTEGDRASYLPHAARMTFLAAAEVGHESKTVHHVRRVRYVRTHDAFSNNEAEHPIVDVGAHEQQPGDLNMHHYRHMYSKRPMPFPYEAEAVFWDNHTQRADVAHILLTVPLPTAVSDFMSLYPVEPGTAPPS